MLLETFSIDGLELLATEDYWLSEGIDGLDEPDRRVPSADNPGADGGFLGNPFYGMRPVSIPGALKGRGPMGLSGARRALGAVCQLKRDANGVKQLKTINFTFDGAAYTFQGEVVRFKAPNVGAGAVEFLISIVAEDPLLYDPIEQVTNPIVRSSGGGLIIPFVVPSVSAGSSGGRGVVTNEGNSDTPVILELVGPLTNPYVLNQTVGQFMQLNYTIPDGTTVLVDTKENTILIEGGGSVIDKKVSGAEFFSLLSGENDIVFSTSNSSDTGHLLLRWHHGSISL